jgi:hypothetical protein
MVYIQDKWSALGLGRPSYLNDDNCNVPLPTIADLPSSTYENIPFPDSGIYQFVGMAKLTTILSDVLSTFYSLKATDRLKQLSPASLYDLQGQFQHRLQGFYDEHLLVISNVDTFLDPTGMFQEPLSRRSTHKL